MSDDFKVTDEQALEWMSQLSAADQQELKRRALEKRAVDLLQPDKGPPNLGAMSDAEFAAYRRSLGIG
jgi:hypothetical protein